MMYNGNNLLIDKYLEVRLFEDGFIDDDDDCVAGYYRKEATFNALAEYIDSCDISTIDELDFIESLGYTASDFKGERQYKVIIETDSIKKILYDGDDFRECLEICKSYNNWGGDYIDSNGTVWSLYYEEYEKE